MTPFSFEIQHTKASKIVLSESVRVKGLKIRGSRVKMQDKGKRMVSILGKKGE
jgi:hypothetical protein